MVPLSVLNVLVQHCGSICVHTVQRLQQNYDILQ